MKMLMKDKCNKVINNCIKAVVGVNSIVLRVSELEQLCKLSRCFKEVLLVAIAAEVVSLK